mmetsp:Transcript_38486/g.98995  ORF Transcript_38486/g.98995 Transcript_38486/m.98995 type:complete len:80 (+) Transcript_38486:1810-2049(+)
MRCEKDVTTFGLPFFLFSQASVSSSLFHFNFPILAYSLFLILLVDFKFSLAAGEKFVIMSIAEASNSLKTRLSLVFHLQ